MPNLTAYEEFKDAKALADVCREGGCSVDQGYDLRNAGYLRGINKSGKFHTTIQHLYEAWRLRAEADLAKKGVKAHAIEPPAENENTRRALTVATARGWTIQGSGR